MEEKAGKNRSDYRKVNRGLVLKLIATGACKSRADLARKMGLSRMALSKIVMELIEQGLLVETEEFRSAEAGRYSIGLSISPKAPRVAGLLIQRDRCEAILTDMSLKVYARETLPVGEGLTKEKLLEVVYQLMDTILFCQENVAAIGVACIGPVSSAGGTILSPFYFYGIHDVPIVQILEKRYGIPTFLDHDNQSAALAEFLYGAGKEYRDILVLGIGNGVGSGIISNGERYSNERGLPPEIGHISIDFNGKKCFCGSRGCIEGYIRTTELLQVLRYHTRKMYSYETFCKIKGDPVVEQIFETAVIQLSYATVNALNILNSQIILLTNDAVYWKDEWIRMLEKEVNERKFVKTGAPVIVRRSFFGHDSSLMGAACNALEQIFSGEILFGEKGRTENSRDKGEAADQT